MFCLPKTAWPPTSESDIEVELEYDDDEDEGDDLPPDDRT